MTNKYTQMREINVTKYVEKKNGLNYLSWAFAVDQLLTNDPSATWEYKETMRFGESLMVFCAVTAFGKTMCAQLPVMDHRNKAISNPDSFQVNVAMQRCLAKAIALHGIGLAIYSGEDLPEADDKQPQPPPAPLLDLTDVYLAMREAEDVDSLKTIFGNAYKKTADGGPRLQLTAKYNEQKSKLEKVSA